MTFVVMALSRVKLKHWALVISQMTSVIGLAIILGGRYLLLVALMMVVDTGGVGHQVGVGPLLSLCSLHLL